MLGAPEILAPALRAGAGWRERAEAWAARGLRVVLFAGGPSRSPSASPTARPPCPPSSRRSALVCFSDELRPGVRQTLEEFSAAGIDVKIISGDNAATVTALATQAGLQTLPRRDGRRHLLRDRSPGPRPPRWPATRPRATSSPSPARSWRACRRRSFAAAADRASVFGRVTPEQKQDLVEALRGRGRYVAMIGDGVNDVIALKQANVAVAMQGGSQAARSVGDLILMKDTFAPLPFAFREGQRIINGMNDILRIFMVRIFFKASMIAIVTAVGGFPFAPRQSALLSFVGATVPAIAFALWAQPGPTPKVGLFKLLARFVIPDRGADGRHRHRRLPRLGDPGTQRLPGGAPGRRREGAHRARLPAGADGADAVRLLLRHPADPAHRAADQVVGRRRAGGARRLAHGGRRRSSCSPAWS